MKRRKLKTFVIYGMYAMSVAMLLGGVYFIESIIDNQSFQSEEIEVMEEVEEVLEQGDDEEDIPVISTEVKIIKPYSNANVKVLKNYYDYKADEKR